MHLTEGKSYYFEALHNDYTAQHFVNVGLKKHTTSLTHDDVPMAVNEVQELKLSSARNNEEQVSYYRSICVQLKFNPVRW